MMCSLRSLLAKLGLKRGSVQNITKRRRRAKAMVPPGFLPIYIGDDRKKYVVPVAFLSEIMCKALLNQFKDENMTAIDNPITLGCSTQLFEGLLNLLNFNISTLTPNL